MTEKKVYLDQDHNFAKPDEADWLLIHEYDETGCMTRETWIYLKG